MDIYNCVAPYARIYAGPRSGVPDQAGQQFFLQYAGDTWIVLKTGLGVDCDVREKHFPTGDSKYEPFRSPFSNVSNFGLVALANRNGSNVRGFGAEVRDVHLTPPLCETTNPFCSETPNRVVG